MPRTSIPTAFPQLPRLLLLVGVSVSAFACGNGGAPAGPASSRHDAAADVCPQDLPACPSAPPSYRTQVSSIVENHCAPCHRAGGLASDREFTSYSLVNAQHAAMLSQVYPCLMPPADGGVQLSLEERTTMLTWLVCGAPDN